MAQRRFLVASGLARLARREAGATRVAEGHFQASGARMTSVIVGGGSAHLVMIEDHGEGAPEVEDTAVPVRQGEALMDVCAGRIEIDQTVLPAPDFVLVLERMYTDSGAVDMVSVKFDSLEQADRFSPPTWLGREVTQDPAFANRALALAGIPDEVDASLSNADLEAFLDWLEGVAKPFRARTSHSSEAIAQRLRDIALSGAKPIHAKDLETEVEADEGGAARLRG